MLLTAAVLAADQAQSPSDQWLGVYMAGQKIGYQHITTEKAAYENNGAYKISSFLRTRMVLLGSNVQQDVKTVTYTNERFAPVFQTFEMSSGGQKTTVTAKFSEKQVDCKVITPNGESKKVVPLPEGISLVGDSMYSLGDGKITVGMKTSSHYFNPMTLSIDPITTEVLRTEQLDYKDKTYATYVVKSMMGSMGDVTTWQTEDGTIIKSVAIMGLTLLVESPSDAVNGVDSNYTPPDDFAVLTSVKANIDLPDARTMKELVIRLSGKLEPKMGISDGRQNVKWLDEAVDGNRAAEFTIEAEKFDASKSVRLPITDPVMAEYLKPTAYLQSDAPEITEKAKMIVGGEKNAYKAAAKIRAWVTVEMKPQADIGIARPSLDVLKNRVGVCRDYAVLFAALARAAGIPTKIVAGIEYMNGNFYYHAWAESWVGQWVPFDATFRSDFVDATHIKLAEGDATDMFQMAPVFGSLKAEIVKHE